MNALDKLDLETLREIFIYANTPKYLYKNLKKDTSVQFIANNNSTDVLITAFNEFLAQASNDCDKAVQLYVILVALTFKNYSEVRPFFQTLLSNKFRWVKEISETFLSEAEITNETVLPPKLVLEPNYKSRSFSSTSKIVDPRRITIKR